MPKVKFKQKTIECPQGSNLRKLLIEADVPPYNGNAQFFNCKGLGTCGTCAVFISGDVSALTKLEKWRLNFPPHKIENNLRLACQCEVLGDIVVEKHSGFWGEKL